MNRDTATAHAGQIMLDYAGSTGLEPVRAHPKRYLWTDAFAVCTCLGLFQRTHDESWRNLALRLVSQVHHTLGRHRDDDPRTGWISGLPEEEGRLHPTHGGLRIGKQTHERGIHEFYNERFEWDRDGQYFHYLTKWMHALNRVSRVTGDPKYTGWAMELAHTAHARFTYLPPEGGRRRMYWKMSIDLTRPLVPAMGQHDPLDGLVTFSELQLTASKDFPQLARLDLSHEIAGLADMCRGMSWATDDPLGTGGLLADASRIAQLAMTGGRGYEELLEEVVGSALECVTSFARGNSLALPAEYRLAFRELGLSIGLKGVGQLPGWIRDNPELSGRKSSLEAQVEALLVHVPLGETIERFWMDSKNQQAGTWTGHREINMVMLATSLAPEGFLMV